VSAEFVGLKESDEVLKSGEGDIVVEAQKPVVDRTPLTTPLLNFVEARKYQRPSSKWQFGVPLLGCVGFSLLPDSISNVKLRISLDTPGFADLPRYPSGSWRYVPEVRYFPFKGFAEVVFTSQVLTPFQCMHVGCKKAVVAGDHLCKEHLEVFERMYGDGEIVGDVASYHQYFYTEVLSGIDEMLLHVSTLSSHLAHAVRFMLHQAKLVIYIYYMFLNPNPTVLRNIAQVREKFRRKVGESNNMQPKVETKPKRKNGPDVKFKRSGRKADAKTPPRGVDGSLWELFWFVSDLFSTVRDALGFLGIPFCTFVECILQDRSSRRNVLLCCGVAAAGWGVARIFNFEESKQIPFMALCGGISLVCCEIFEWRLALESKELVQYCGSGDTKVPATLNDDPLLLKRLSTE
jgi:hypothetical protein